MTNEITIESYQEIFEIILDDLISNAIKFTPNGGKITIGIEQEYNDFIRFFVKDTGIGIEEGVDVFSEEYSTPALDGGKGTGWGLTNAKIYTEIMQRNIYHEPNIPQGTKFIFAINKTPLQKGLQK